MKNVLEIEGHKAVISLDPDIGMLRGEFAHLSGGADFYASSVEALYEEGRKSLQTYLELCQKKGVEPSRKFSGRFNVRIDPELHAAAVMAAAAEAKSLNEWIIDAIKIAAQQT